MSEYQEKHEVCSYPPPKGEGYRFGVVRPSVRLSVCLQPYSVTNEGNFMKLIMDTYDLGAVMHVQFHKDIISHRTEG